VIVIITGTSALMLPAISIYEFRRIYKEVSKRILQELDVRIHFQQKEYAGMKIRDLVNVENVDAYYWQHYAFINGLGSHSKVSGEVWTVYHKN